MSISPWKNHISKASYWSERAQVLIRPPSQGDLPDVGLRTLPPPLKVGVLTAALCDTSLSEASLDHSQLLRWLEPLASSPFRLASSQ